MGHGMKDEEPNLATNFDTATVRSTAAIAPTKPPRYLTRHQAQLQRSNQAVTPQKDSRTPDVFAQQMEQAYQVEVLQPNQAITTMDPLMFLPAPSNWRQISKLPPAIQKRWDDALLIEIKELVTKGTFRHETPRPNDPVIPVTSKYCVKLTPEGMIEKLMARIALRGDLMRDNVCIPDT
jgi:hypothetical protein